MAFYCRTCQPAPSFMCWYGGGGGRGESEERVGLLTGKQDPCQVSGLFGSIHKGHINGSQLGEQGGLS